MRGVCRNSGVFGFLGHLELLAARFPRSESMTGLGVLVGKAKAIVSTKPKFAVLPYLTNTKSKIPPWSHNREAMVPEFSWWRHCVAPSPTS